MTAVFRLKLNQDYSIKTYLLPFQAFSSGVNQVLPVKKGIFGFKRADVSKELRETQNRVSNSRF
jgi:hypothetical protein